MAAPDLHLTIRLHQALNLVAADFGGTSDPYVVFHIGSNWLKSSRVPNTINPVWSPPEDFHFVVKAEDIEKEYLFVEVKDWDRFSSDDPLGTFSIPIRYLKSHENKGAERFQIMNPDGTTTANGQPSYVVLTILILTEKEYQSTVIDQVWQNERWVPSLGFSADNLMISDPGKWSSKDNTKSSSNFSDVAPIVPEGWESDGWNFTTEQGDDQGWMYALTFSGPWYKENSMLMAVRRRKWQNIRRPAEIAEVASKGEVVPEVSESSTIAF